jgi:hypothetical protein
MCKAICGGSNSITGQSVRGAQMDLSVVIAVPLLPKQSLPYLCLSLPYCYFDLLSMQKKMICFSGVTSCVSRFDLQIRMQQTISFICRFCERQSLSLIVRREQKFETFKKKVLKKYTL